MIRFIAALTFLLFSLQIALANGPGADIGKAVKVVNKVDLLTDDGVMKITIGSPIHTQETVATGHNSSSQFTMRDDTRLAIGPNSRLLLDKFVYDPNPDSRELVLEGFKGAMRFVTGHSPSKTYTINTPSAVIGVRGTMFDVYIGDDEKTMVALLKGKVNVCPTVQGSCRDLNKTGRFLTIDRQGRFKISDTPNRTILGAVAFGKAFPFLAAKKRLGGKLGAPVRLRQQIRKQAGLRQIRKKTRVKKPVRRHNRARSRLDDDGDFRPPARHKKSVSRRQEGRDYRPPARHKKSVSRRQQGGKYQRPRHKKSTSRRARRNGGIKLRLNIPIPGLDIFKGKTRSRGRYVK